MTAATMPRGAAISPATQRMLHGPVLPTLLRLATPNVLGLFANTIVIGFDGYIVGRLGGDALAGVALVLPLAMLMLQMSAGGLGGTTTAAVARALGAGEPRRATMLAQHALVIGVAASLLFTLLASGSWFYAALGARDNVLSQATGYASILFAGASAIWTVNVLGGIARGTGNMIAAAVGLVGTTLLHLLLCPLLVFGAGPIPALGVAGAATSTVTVNAVGALALIAWLSRRASPVRIIGPAWKLEAAAFRSVLAVAVPSSFSSILSNTAILMSTAFVGTFGSIAIAAYGIAARLEYILVPIAFGVGGALTAMVAANLGAHQPARAKRVTWAGAALVWLITGGIGLVAAVQPSLWMATFTSDPAIQAAGSSYLRIVGGSYGFFGLGLALFFASQGAGRMRWPLVASSSRLAVVAIGGWLLLHLSHAQVQPEALYAIIAAGLAVMGVTVALATHLSNWDERGAR